MSNPVPVAVVGVGHMGRHHVRIYSEMDETDLVGIVDANSDRAAEMAKQFNTRPYDSIEPLLDKVQAVSIAVPTIAHVDIARPPHQTRHHPDRCLPSEHSPAWPRHACSTW